MTPEEARALLNNADGDIAGEHRQQTLCDLARRLRDLVNRVRRHERLWRGPNPDYS